MISSTALDLPEHRRQVIDACLRQSILPIAMEHLPARDASALQVSLNMMDEADVFIGVYGWRYGWVPDGAASSITELEFDRAVELKRAGKMKEILVFLMHAEHDVKQRDVEADAGAQKRLKKFKKRASTGRICREFRNPDDLRGLVVEALADFRRRLAAAKAEPEVPQFHIPPFIPDLPRPYIAHPYLLLETERVVGRQHELELLTRWVREIDHGNQKPILSVIALGGMGKSALTWKWFEEVAPNEVRDFTGRMWWSFYESNAHWENFVVHALAYMAELSESEARKLAPSEREERLLRLLDTHRFLIVFDGLERILLAYSRMDAAHLCDDNLDSDTANALASTSGLPEHVRESYIEKHRLRRCADLRAGAFLRKLARVRCSKILISSRLYPAELQTQSAQLRPGCDALFLEGMTDNDALALWREFLASDEGGTADELLPLFGAIGNYPLLLRALAGEVARYRRAPGDFRRWRKDHSDFDPVSLPLNNAKTHVLSYALSGLNEPQQRVLHMLAAFRMPTPWETLRDISVGEWRSCRTDRDLDDALTNLEDRGLVSWDRAANRYDLHPIVRAVVWAALNPAARQDVHGTLHAYFNAIPTQSYETIQTLDELTPAIELFYMLTDSGHFEGAYRVFVDRIESVLLKRLSAGRRLIELLERFFPNGIKSGAAFKSQVSPFKSDLYESALVNCLALAYDITGEPAKAAVMFGRAIALDEYNKRDRDLSVHRCNLALALWPSGHLRDAYRVIRRALRDVWLQSSYKTRTYAIISSARGEYVEASAFLLKELSRCGDPRQQGTISAHLAQTYLWSGNYPDALAYSQSAWTLAHVERRERDLVRSARVCGLAALLNGDLASAADRLHEAVVRAREINFVQEELPALIGLAELNRQCKNYDASRELLEDVWSGAERGPYPLWHSDARNVLVQIERDVNDRRQAIESALHAYRLAWCDGPPFCYEHGLAIARRHLRELNVAEPSIAAHLVRSSDEVQSSDSAVS